MSKINHSDLVKTIIKNSILIKDKIIVIKLPSIIIDNNDLLINFAENIELLNECGAKLIIIHDYSKIIEQSLDIASRQKEQGILQIFEYKSPEIIEMVLSGHINKLIVSKLCTRGLQALGMSGKDGSLLVSKNSDIGGLVRARLDAMRQKHLNHKKKTEEEPLFVNPEILFSLEQTEIIPVIAPVASNQNGRTTIIDLDVAVVTIAAAIGAEYLIMLGSDNFFAESYAKFSDAKEFKDFIDNNIEASQHFSLIKNINYAFESLEVSVHFANAKNPNSLLSSIFE